jgi:cell fate regulator YaaT (PSP1 superfamily)
MKISDIEFQGDGSKATFYYTANDRIDFRLLIKDFAKEFSTRIEMKQVGFRQKQLV